MPQLPKNTIVCSKCASVIPVTPKQGSNSCAMIEHSLLSITGVNDEIGSDDELHPDYLESQDYVLCNMCAKGAQALISRWLSH